MFSGFELYPRWVPLIYAPRNYWYAPKSTVVREGAGHPASRASFEVFWTSQSCFLYVVKLVYSSQASVH